MANPRKRRHGRLPLIVATTGWPLPADPLEGVRSVGAVFAIFSEKDS